MIRCVDMTCRDRARGTHMGLQQSVSSSRGREQYHGPALDVTGQRTMLWGSTQYQGPALNVAGQHTMQWGAPEGCGL